MNRVLKEKDFLTLLKKAGPHHRRSIIKTATPKQIASICEVCLNVLSNNVPLSSHRRNKLATHKNLIRYLAKKSVSLKNKKAYLLKKQSGGFLPILASLLPGLLGGLLGGLT